MKNHTEVHEFACYLSNIPEVIKGKKKGDLLPIVDESLQHRIIHVLRMNVGDQLVIFDEKKHICATIASIAKRACTVSIDDIKTNTILHPSITLLLPLLKKDALVDAVYSAVELGANQIQLVSTQKSQRSSIQKHELDRLTQVLIAAAEQSKNFAFPLLLSPVSFEQSLKNIPTNSFTIFCDPDGIPLLDVMNNLKAKKPQSIVVMIGPEGDLHESEKAMLKSQQFTMCALTPTIIRARQALAVALGAVRAVFK